MGRKSMGRKVIQVFANAQKDVRYRIKRSTEYKDYTVKKIKQTGKDAMGLKEYTVTLFKKRGK